jgi:hypothetical protein
MVTLHVILVEAFYCGILLLFTATVGALSGQEEAFDGVPGVRFIQECRVVPDFVKTERRFLVVFGERVPYQPVHGTGLRRLEPGWSPLSVRNWSWRSSKVGTACLE